MITLVKNVKDANCITHSGTMHADEVFATAFLELYLKDIKLIRVADIDTKNISSQVIVYDIGRNKFDHHQKDAQKRENGITYSSFGLLWQEFGLAFLKKEQINDYQEVFFEIDKDFIEGIDAVDNGIFPKIEAPYKVKTLSDIIKLFNPSYKSKEEENKQFLKAVTIAKDIFSEEILHISGKVQARKKVIEKLRNNNKPYLILEEYIPYEETILKEDTENKILLVIFPSNRGGYAIKTLSKSLEDNTTRLDFPKEWAGLTNEALEEKTKVKGATFCHTNLFICCCQTLKQAIMIAEKTINIQNK